MTHFLTKQVLAVLLGVGLLFILPSEALADGEGNAINTSPFNVEFENPVGTNSIDGLLANVLSAIRGVVGVLAVLFIVIGGVIYMTSAGNPQRMEWGKKAVLASCIGLALAIIAPTLLREIYGVLGETAPGEAGQARTLKEIALNVLRIILSLVGALAIIMIVVGGIMYMTSGGDTNRAQGAMRIVIGAVVGLIIVLLALTIVREVAKALTFYSVPGIA